MYLVMVILFRNRLKTSLVKVSPSEVWLEVGVASTNVGFSSSQGCIASSKV